MNFLKEINFRQPKYILPLIIAPFLVLLYYVMGRLFVSDENKQNTHQVEGYNTKVPIPASEQDIAPKFESLQEDFNAQESNLRSYLEELGEEEEEKGIIVDLMTQEERLLKDSIDISKDITKKIIEQQKKKLNQIIGHSDNSLSGYLSPTINHEEEVLKIASLDEKDIIDKEFTNNENLVENKVSEDLEQFKKRFRALDSLQNPSKYLVNEQVSSNSEPEEQFAKLNPSKKQASSIFNTISNENKKTSIRALMDEGIIIYKGSRIRLRLMKDVFIDELYLKKGSYLYGVVKSFRDQRVIINIPSILLDGEIIQTNISIYDLDGLEGVFVPSSQFRSFVNDLGGGTAGNTGSSLGNQGSTTNQNLSDQLLFDAATSAVQTSTKAIEKLIRKNKARFKYNSQVILKNN